MVGGCCLLKGMFSMPESAYPSCYTEMAQTKSATKIALYNLAFYRSVLSNHSKHFLPV